MNRFLTKRIKVSLTIITVSSFLLLLAYPIVTLAQSAQGGPRLPTTPTTPTTSDAPTIDSYREFYSTQYNQALEDLAPIDPSANNQPSAGAGVPGIPNWGDTAQGCLGALGANYIGSSITGALGLAGKGVESLVDATGLLALEVPVKDAQERAKNTGSGTVGGVISLVPSWDAVGNCIFNIVIESILTSTAEWVKNGFEGNPAFVDDPEQFFLDIADTEAGTFLNELTGIDLCAPWDIEIRLALLKRYTETDVTSCSLTEIVANTEDFLDGNFEEGGWKGWFTLTQETNNNPYDLYINSQYSLSSRAASLPRSNIVEAELGWGKGFFGISLDGKTTTPGTLLESSINQRLNSNVWRMTFADEFDEVINALVNHLLENSVGDILR